MEHESRQLIEDCFLRPISNPRSTNVPAEPPPSKSTLKVEMQILRLSDDNKNLIMDTLKSIHGTDYKLHDISKYKDKGSRINNGYWQDRGTLIVQGGCDYSIIPKSNTTMEDRLFLYAITKLESYGFHKQHCIEAFNYCNQNMDETLELLFIKYFPHTINSEDEVNNAIPESELIEIREDEKLALESIYDKLFEEKEKNCIWQLKFRIDYLLKLTSTNNGNATNNNKDDKIMNNKKHKIKDKCRNFLKGKCKFGDRCRFSHEIEKINTDAIDAKKKEDDDLNWFYLEIRFPKKSCNYPYSPPMIFLRTTSPDIPTLLCLRISRYLINEARKLSIDGMPSIYTISELLQMNDDIELFLKNDKYKFLNCKKSIFDPDVYDENDNDNAIKENLNLPTRFDQGSIGRSDNFKTSLADELKENLLLLKSYQTKQNQDNYKVIQKDRLNLPILAKFNEIIELINNNQLIIINGETGCGKSTQLPQFLLDDYFKKLSQDNKLSNRINIICTQPRKISAIGLAERVSYERIDKLGNLIGYQVHLDNKISKKTRLTYCTIGILLRRLNTEPLLNNITHLIIDEIHERSEEIDFLLLIIKELIIKRKDIKIILMSATINVKLYEKYFNNIKIMNISGRTFPVEELFLENILDKCNFVLDYNNTQYLRKLNNKNDDELLYSNFDSIDINQFVDKPLNKTRDEDLSISDFFARYNENTKQTCKTLYLMDHNRINPELVEIVLLYIINGDHNWPKHGTILVFLPGLNEIQLIYDTLKNNHLICNNNFIVIPLHSSLSNEEQSQIFNKTIKKRKIILSTNIAETSITIDDCIFVIDCGKMKEKFYDINRNMESLDLVWISCANSEQRKGRAGRVMSGVCIHLFTEYRYNYHMLKQPIPEIHRIPLEQVLLRIKTLNLFNNRDITDVMSHLIEPPNENNTITAIIRLQDVGAFDNDESLTPLGHHLSKLPVDVRIGKLIIYGTIFNCIDSILTIASFLSYKTPFLIPFNKKQEANNKKFEFLINNSDHLTILNAYKKWQEMNRKSKYSGKCFANNNYLSIQVLDLLTNIKYQFLELLVSIGFIPINLDSNKKRTIISLDNIEEITGVDMNKNGNNYRLLSAIICAALYPNIVKILTPEKSYTQTMGGAIPKDLLPNELRFKTKSDGYVYIHPSSVNSKISNFSSAYLVFQEKIKTSRIFIRDCTMITLLPLVFFSGNTINIELHGGDFIILLENNWIMIKADSHQVAEMIKQLRVELVKLLEEKIRDPYLNLAHHDNGQRVISTIVHLLTKES